MKRGAAPTRITVVTGPICASDGAPDGPPDEVCAALTRPRWLLDPSSVRRWIDELRMRFTVALPSAAHEALATLQRAMGARCCVLATTATDGLLQKASAETVIELRGSVFQARCEVDPAHPRLPISAFEARLPRCTCGAAMRPDVVLTGEPLQALERIEAAIQRSDLVMAVGVDPALSQWIRGVAQAAGVRTLAFGWPALEPEAISALDGFDEVHRADPEVGVPELVEGWLAR